MAGELERLTDRLGMPLIYKSSFDKANRTSAASARGIGLEQGHRDPGRGQGGHRPAGAHRRPRELAVQARGRGGRRAADPGLPLPPDRPAARRGRDRPGDQRQEGPVPGALGHAAGHGQARELRLPAASWSASAAPASATTRWSPTCAACRSSPPPAGRWCSTPPIRCSSRAASAAPAAASASTCRCWRARRWPSASPPCSSRPTSSPTGRPATARTWCRWRGWRSCSTDLQRFDALAKAKPPVAL